MTGVIMHTCEKFDENCHPRQGPQIRTETVGPRSSAQFPVQTLNLSSIESGLASGSASAPQSAHATSFPLFIPAADALAAHSESPRDLGHDPLPSSEHARCLAAPLFQRSKISSHTKFGRHAHIVRAARMLVTLLCEVQ